MPVCRTDRFALLATLLTIACTTEPGAPDPDGDRIYRSRVDDGNSFTCATCHALSEPAGDGMRRPGHALHDAAARSTYKNGTLTELLDAVNSCLAEWMNAEPWREDDDRWIALSSFLEDLAPDRAEDLRFEIVAPAAFDEAFAGDAEHGRAVFNESCAVCHGQDGVGTQLGPPVAGFGLDPSYVARRVRTSGRSDSGVYDGLTGGVMPFWSADRLSDDELRDIAAWLSEIDTTPAPASDDGGDDGDAPSGACTRTHPKIGQVAELVEMFHDVGGTAEIVDDCTIAIRDFTFDGNGIDVRIYGGLGGDFDDGFAMSDDLRQSGGYAGATLTLRLPEDRTLDDLDGLSVWCVTVGVDFGSGFFR